MSAQRYEVRRIVAGVEEASHTHLAVRTSTTAPTRNGAITSRAACKSGDVVLPEWFREIPFESFDCNPVGDRLTPKGR